jgi:soluble lytic murein transglycosylase-like protein
MPTAAACALERVTLKSGFAIECVRHEAVEGSDRRVRLYLADGYLDVAAESIVRVEVIPDPVPVPVVSASLPVVVKSVEAEPTAGELQHLLAKAGAEHRIDADLLASVVHAESGGRVRAVSRTGAQGLMQLMPGTAAEVGVKDAFVAAENVEGGTKYLDGLLTKYHDNLALALAAYNAGPAAVAKYHGVPPFAETRAYVVRVIREFNRRKLALARAGLAKAGHQG